MTLKEVLLTHSWWRYDPLGRSLADNVYRWFNLVEGGVWLVIALLVAVRFGKHRHSSLELLYSLWFASFGVTDFIEATELTSWLIWLKLVLLIGLLLIRRTIIRRYYPAARGY